MVGLARVDRRRGARPWCLPWLLAGRPLQGLRPLVTGRRGAAGGESLAVVEAAIAAVDLTVRRALSATHEPRSMSRVALARLSARLRPSLRAPSARSAALDLLATTVHRLLWLVAGASPLSYSLNFVELPSGPQTNPACECGSRGRCRGGKLRRVASAAPAEVLLRRVALAPPCVPGLPRPPEAARPAEWRRAVSAETSVGTAGVRCVHWSRRGQSARPLEHGYIAVVWRRQLPAPHRLSLLSLPRALWPRTGG